MPSVSPRSKAERQPLVKAKTTSRKQKSTKTKRKSGKTVRILEQPHVLHEYENLTPQTPTPDSRDYTLIKECPDGYDEPDFPCFHRRMLFETMEELDEFNAIMEYKSAEKRRAHYDTIRRKMHVSPRKRKPKQLGGTSRRRR